MAFRVTGDFKADVNDPLFKEGEERMLAWFRQHEASDAWPWLVVDNRDKHREGDFILLPRDGGRDYLIDIKVDQWSVRTGRFAWEEKLVQADGTERPGWGKSPHLDYIVYVMPEAVGAESLWEAWIVDARRLHTHVEHLTAHKSLQSLTGHGWKQFDKHNTDGRRGVGWAIPRQQLRPITKRIIFI